MTEEQLDAPFESTRDAGSTPATSTILPSVYWGFRGYSQIIAHIFMGVLNTFIYFRLRQKAYPRALTPIKSA